MNPAPPRFPPLPPPASLPFFSPPPPMNPRGPYGAQAARALPPPHGAGGQRRQRWMAVGLGVSGYGPPLCRCVFDIGGGVRYKDRIQLAGGCYGSCSLTGKAARDRSTRADPHDSGKTSARRASGNARMEIFGRALVGQRGVGALGRD